MNAKSVTETKMSDLSTTSDKKVTGVSKATSGPKDTTENGDTDGRSQIVDTKGKKVTCSYFVRKSDGAPRHTLHTVFDFSKVTEAELYGLAMYAVKVKAQALWRSKEHDPLKPNAGFDKMDVKDQIIDQARAPRDPAQAARRALDKMTPEQRAILLAELSKQK
jgi:hypothetical protein